MLRKTQKGCIEKNTIHIRLIKVKIYKTFPIEQADEAQQVLYRGENVGKVVLVVKED